MTTAGNDRSASTAYAQRVPPKINSIGFDKNTGPTPLTVKFTPDLTTYEDTPPVYSWDFGDGLASAESAPSHTYAYSGIFFCTLTVYNSAGLHSAANARISVSSGGDSDNHQPQITNITAVPSFKLDSAGNTAVTFNCTAVDADEDTLVFHWDFGDGHTGEGAASSHTYIWSETNKIHTVLLTVSESKINPASIQRKLYVAVGPSANTVNLPPVINDFYITSIVADSGENVQFLTPCDVFVSANAIDYDGSISSYEWSFGNGAAGDRDNARCRYAGEGTYTIRLTVTDDKGGTAVLEKNLKLNGQQLAS
ncbi:MAG: PKD domain-containing protein [Candidatus Margulisbacteria bacterium]|nr:PKD domain-containing protein [Candidatus Margulisiibacteriota bacterium]